MKPGDYTRIAWGVVDSHYPEIARKRITIRIEVIDDPRKFELFTMSDYLGYTVYGAIPREMDEDSNLERMIKGLLGHEFSHIVRGDMNSIKDVFLRLLTKVPQIGENIELSIERAADRETVRRNLGNEFYQAMKYIEEMAGRHNLKLPVRGYNSRQLLELVFAHKEPFIRV